MRTAFGFVLLTLISNVVATPSHKRQNDLEFEYIVVGSGGGGGPLASRLAENGHSVLLIEAGDDQGGNANISVPGYQAAVTQDPKLRWDIYVNHYQDQERAQRDPKFVYGLPDGTDYIGTSPPNGADPKGILYPRAATLGGCISHNALIFIEPFASDWNGIADLTGDNTWNAVNMQQYYDRVYEWQPTEPTDPAILLRDYKFVKHLAGGATTQGFDVGITGVDTLSGLASLLVDPNNDLPNRDSTEGFFQIPLISKGGTRVSIRERIVAVAASNPLTIRTHCLATKVIFDDTDSTKAIGVEFLDGAHLYEADPLASGGGGSTGRAYATKEIILAGGAFNTPQLLKLSGIGPADELAQFNIPLVKDLPGVGTNMQDRYEVPVNVKHPDDFPILDGCTFDMKDQDLCYDQWRNNVDVLAARGAYASNGLGATMVERSDTADSTDVDLYIFGGPINFIGYFPQWGDYAVADHKHFSWYTLKAKARNRAGTVKLRSADPRIQPRIDFNYFDTGTTENGADQKDIAAIVQAIRQSREALSHYYDYPVIPGTPFVEERPGTALQSDEELGQYVKDVAWGHHASCTCPIGADDDPMAVLDSEFRVRGIQNLRVVDASVFPRIPGSFIQAPIFIMAEKAADVIMKAAQSSTSTSTSSTSSTTSTTRSSTSSTTTSQSLTSTISTLTSTSTSTLGTSTVLLTSTATLSTSSEPTSTSTTSSTSNAASASTSATYITSTASQSTSGGTTSTMSTTLSSSSGTSSMSFSMTASDSTTSGSSTIQTTKMATTVQLSSSYTIPSFTPRTSSLLSDTSSTRSDTGTLSVSEFPYTRTTSTLSPFNTASYATGDWSDWSAFSTRHDGTSLPSSQSDPKHSWATWVGSATGSSTSTAIPTTRSNGGHIIPAKPSPEQPVTSFHQEPADEIWPVGWWAEESMEKVVYVCPANH